MRYNRTMESRSTFLNPVVAACAMFFVVAPVQASESNANNEVSELLAELKEPDQERWQRIERQIARLWSRSGSASADLLLQRGREAMSRGDTTAAIDHFSALIDHAPDFAEGYHARATAWYMAGNLGLALDDLRQAIVRNPDHFSALAGLGRVFEDLRQYERARAAFRASAAIHPHRADVKEALERVERELTGIAL